MSLCFWAPLPCPNSRFPVVFQRLEAQLEALGQGQVPLAPGETPILTGRV